jgi:hypothetical protein
VNVREVLVRKQHVEQGAGERQRHLLVEHSRVSLIDLIYTVAVKLEEIDRNRHSVCH